jgi:hypothetical protein
MADGELLATGVPTLARVGRHRTLYDREKLRAHTHRQQRQLSGKDWVMQRDGATGHPFWLNVDSGEAVWEPPAVLKQLAGEANARAGGFGLLPLDQVVSLRQRPFHVERGFSKRMGSSTRATFTQVVL